MELSNLLIIHYNTEHKSCLSFENASRAIGRFQPLIQTNCISLASFDYLEIGYEVIIARKGKGGFEFIALSELLVNERPYINKEIRSAHNVLKLLQTGALNFLPPSDYIQSRVRDIESVSNITLLEAMDIALANIQKQDPAEYVKQVEECKDGPIATAMREIYGHSDLNQFPFIPLEDENIVDTDDTHITVTRAQELPTLPLSQTWICTSGCGETKPTLSVMATETEHRDGIAIRQSQYQYYSCEFCKSPIQIWDEKQNIEYDYNSASGEIYNFRSCNFNVGNYQCRGDGYLYDADFDSYDPHDLSHPCPSCRTLEFLKDAKQDAESTSYYSNNGMSGSGKDIWESAVRTALDANPDAAHKALKEIGKVEALHSTPLPVAGNTPEFEDAVTVFKY